MNSTILERASRFSEFERDMVISHLTRETFDRAKMNYRPNRFDVFKSRMSFTTGEIERALILSGLSLCLVVSILLAIMMSALYIVHFS